MDVDAERRGGGGGGGGGAHPPFLNPFFGFFLLFTHPPLTFNRGVQGGEVDCAEHGTLSFGGHFPDALSSRGRGHKRCQKPVFSLSFDREEEEDHTKSLLSFLTQSAVGLL